MSVNIHEGDVGVIFEVEILENEAALNVSAATTKTMIFKGPTTAAQSFTAVFTTDGTDGKIRYTTTTDVFTEHGAWEYQVKLDFAGGVVLYTPPVRFTVDAVHA